MAAGVAHELNNPLTTIAGFVELALDELPADLPQHEELTLVMGEALRARRVVRGLLDFAHQSSNLRQPADLNALLNEVLTLVQLQAQNSNIQIQLERSGDLPQIQVDVNQIKQVVINLIQNAFQSMPQGGSLILTTGQQAHEGQAGVFLTVQDSGEGISPENLGRIFDPFYTTRPVGKGTGLGLSMSYGLVTGHGGVLSVESQVGSGACFRVWLPLEMEASSA
jgi:two-component system NtrC family sensor kinase